jgi:glutamyl-tRNA synthetase
MSVRFAPSPTGDLHIGNFRTAWISWAWSRALGMPWVVRMEDIDAPRVVPGAREKQLAELEGLGLRADLLVTQSDRLARHRELFDRAVREGRVYPCSCSRAEVRRALDGLASAPHDAAVVYDGSCRRRPANVREKQLGWRFRMDDESGRADFLVARTVDAEFVPAYAWACAIDDLDGGHALLVRAWDLEPALAPQRAIQRWLSQSPLPAVFHAALVTRDDGARLEKRTRGVTLSELAAAGVTPAELVRRFERGFRLDAADYAPERVFGEPRRELPLTELI